MANFIEKLSQLFQTLILPDFSPECLKNQTQVRFLQYFIVFHSLNILLKTVFMMQ